MDTSKFQDTQYPFGTLRSWEVYDPFSHEERDPIFKLPDPETSTYDMIYFYEYKNFYEFKRPLLRSEVTEDMEIPIRRLYRRRVTLVGPGETLTGEAFIRDEESAHIHRIYGWSEEPGDLIRRVHGKYLRPEFRRPRWEVEHKQETGG